MSTVLKLIISIFKFMWKKLGVPGILFLILLVLIPFGVTSFDNASDDYVYEDQWEIGNVTVEQKEKTEDVVAMFSEYELDEEYGKKYIYQVQVMVTNQGVNPLYIDRVFNFLYVEDDSGRMLIGKTKDYYYEMDEYDRLDTTVIAPGRTMPVQILFVFEEDRVPRTLEFFEDYEGDSLFTVDIPAPVEK